MMSFLLGWMNGIIVRINSPNTLYQQGHEFIAADYVPVDCLESIILGRLVQLFAKLPVDIFPNYRVSGWAD
jgi:hypothetical protein